MTASSKIRYLVFDIESVSDGELVARLRYPQEKLSPQQAIAKYRAELMEKNGTDFVPYPFQVPISLVAAKVDAEFQLIDLVALDEPDFRPHMITEKFWRGWEKFRHPTLVSFNGRTFDLPLLELAAFRYGIAIPGWFNVEAKAYDQHRNRYNLQAHLDLQDLFTNFGATRFNGGLNLASNILGKPGKMDVQGYMVQDLYDGGRLVEINDYCRCDVLDTYFVFLRTRVMLGQMTLDQEQETIAQTKKWLEDQADTVRAYQMYLEHWADWQNPWDAEAAT